MKNHTINVALNQQQVELLDNTVSRGAATDREALIRLALKEFAEKHAILESGSPKDTADGA